MTLSKYAAKTYDNIQYPIIILTLTNLEYKGSSSIGPRTSIKITANQLSIE